MVFLKRTGGETVTVVIGKDGDKVVKIKGRTLTPAEGDACRRLAYGKLKGKQIGAQSFVKLVERAEAETIERAIRETHDSENFSVQLSEADVAVYGKALGREVKAGEEVLLDGHWTDEIRRELFETTEGLAKRVDDAFGKLVLGEAMEEAEDIEDF